MHKYNFYATYVPYIRFTQSMNLGMNSIRQTALQSELVHKYRVYIVNGRPQYLQKVIITFVVGQYIMRMYARTYT